MIRLKVIDQQAEVKSDASVDAAGSKVVVNFGCGEHSLTVEATPDFYVCKQALIVYLMIGEVGSKGSKDPEMQLAIGTLGMLAKRKTTKIGAVLLRRNLDCCVFIGTCSWLRTGYGSVTFKRVNRARWIQIRRSRRAGNLWLYSCCSG